MIYKPLKGRKSNQLNDFIEKYEESQIGNFIEDIKNDIAPATNAISYNESNRFIVFPQKLF